MLLLKKGDRVRLKTRTLFGGWKGKGTVIEDQLHRESIIMLEPDEKPGTTVAALRHEVAKLRDQNQ